KTSPPSYSLWGLLASGTRSFMPRTSKRGCTPPVTDILTGRGRTPCAYLPIRGTNPAPCPSTEKRPRLKPALQGEAKRIRSHRQLKGQVSIMVRALGPPHQFHRHRK